MVYFSSSLCFIVSLRFFFNVVFPLLFFGVILLSVSFSLKQKKEKKKKRATTKGKIKKEKKRKRKETPQNKG